MAVVANTKQILSTALDKALTSQQPLARGNVERMRRVHPDESPAELIRRIERLYLGSVTVSGGAAGGAGSVPGAGIPVALLDVLGFTEASVLYTLSLAEIHDIHPDDLETRRLLVLTVLVGDAAVSALEKTTARTGPYWARAIVEAIPMSAINRVNKILGPRFVTKYGTQQGVLVLGKQVPLGVGALLGGGGNHVFARLTIKTARRIFGPAPEEWPTA